MNPRIYKKQAKRSVELLRSHEGWTMPLKNMEIYGPSRHDHPYSGWKSNIGIDGSPVLGYWSSTMDGREWDERCARSEWCDLHYWTFVVPEDHFKTGNEPLPKMTIQQCRQRFSTKMIATGWRWRGNRAIKDDRNV
ncbi:MAG TPA: hypothetical protein VEC35_01045 [Noviherbaspirillum sp.]|nr:hypothetical protein [Noviherbaspirillum sp.]